MMPMDLALFLFFSFSLSLRVTGVLQIFGGELLMMLHACYIVCGDAHN